MVISDFFVKCILGLEKIEQSFAQPIGKSVAWEFAEIGKKSSEFYMLEFFVYYKLLSISWILDKSFMWSAAGNNMGSLYRSELMSLCQLFLHSEMAYSEVAKLGELGVVHFIDVGKLVIFRTFSCISVSELNELIWTVIE